MVKDLVPRVHFYDQDFVDMYDRTWVWLDEIWHQGDKDAAFPEGFFTYGDDGTISLFDVMFTNHPLSGRELIKAVIAFFRGSQVSDTNLFTYMNATKVEIASEEPVVQAHCDGEAFTKNGTLFSISLLPGALGLVRGKIS